MNGQLSQGHAISLVITQKRQFSVSQLHLVPHQNYGKKQTGIDQLFQDHSQHCQWKHKLRTELYHLVNTVFKFISKLQNPHSTALVAVVILQKPLKLNVGLLWPCIVLLPHSLILYSALILCLGIGLNITYPDFFVCV